MKKIIVLLLSVISIVAYSQNNNLSVINSVKPKLGQKMAFEAAYKVHIAKFHKADEKINVYEVLSGKYMGFYHLVNGGKSYASLDNERADATAHSMDLDKTYFPLLDETMNGTYRYVDSLSFHSDIKAEKFLVNTRHIKLSMVDDYRKEVARGAKILGKLKAAFWDNLSQSVFQLLWAGTDPVYITVRNLKDGFKSLETDFYGPMNNGNPSFQDEYIKAYGTLDWDKRVKILDEAVVKNEQYIMRLRKDLSSQ